jgi:hypothetical protein
VTMTPLTPVDGGVTRRAVAPDEALLERYRAPRSNQVVTS